jgi:hypothetical protein
MDSATLDINDTPYSSQISTATPDRVAVLDFYEVFMAKHMKDMNAEELENFIKQH